MVLKGYYSEAYTQIFENQGRIKWLNNGIGGGVLEQDNPNTGYKELESLYPVYPSFEVPFLSFNDRLKSAIDSLEQEQIYSSITLVTDPSSKCFSDLYTFYSLGEYRNKIKLDLFEPHQNHYIVRLQSPWVIKSNHYHNIKKSMISGVQISQVTIAWTIYIEN